VLRFIWSQFRFRRSRTGALALGILVASVSFTLLTASSRTSSLHVHGTLAGSFRPAYDILVRPLGGRSQLELDRSLVRPNFLSGLYGGITFKQWRAIERLHDVSVAAPVANVGYVLPLENIPIQITNLVTKDPFQIYRIRQTWVANGGVSRYSAPDLYVYFTPHDVFTASRGQAFTEVGPSVKSPLQSCSGFRANQPDQPQSPFPPVASRSYRTCFPAKWEELGFGAPFSVNGFYLPRSPRWVGAVSAAYSPIYITAIDPIQEAKLVHLDDTVVRGRYLKPSEGLAAYTPTGNSTHYKMIPVLASSRTYVDERLDLRIERLRLPQSVDIPRVLASGACAGRVSECATHLAIPGGVVARSVRSFVQSLPGDVIAHRSVGFSQIYRQLLSSSPGAGWRSGILSPDAYWTTSSTQYRAPSLDTLAPIAVRNPPSIWSSKFSNFYTPPRDNLDPQFRRLHERISTNIIRSNVAQWNPMQVVGEFDPTMLPTFSPLSRVPLETYAPPQLAAADSASAAALQQRPLEPNQNLGGYIQQPPLLLTTMQGLQSFLRSDTWERVNGGSAIPAAQRNAPISAIRVKVKGVTGPDALSLTRIRIVAQQIHEKTGLAVDITAGSSPHRMLIELPKGNFGQPPLRVYEGWSKKGVTVAFLRALDRKDLALFALILIICAFFLGNGALASVRARSTEVGTLLTLGWTGSAIFRAILAEIAVAGLLAGLFGVGVAEGLVAMLSLHVSITAALLVLPVALVLALAAGALPAWSAARGTPLDAIRPPILIRKRARAVGRLVTLARVNLTRVPGRTALGSVGLVLGVAALTILIGIQHSFQGTLVGTVLGNTVSLQVRGADFVAVGLTIALAALSVADVVYLNLRERAAELVTLKTLGWAPRHILFLILFEGVGLGLCGSVTGALVGIGAGLLLSVPLGSLALAAIIAALGGVAAAIAASILPLTQISRLTAPVILAGE
jgi:putative ABC transport system permease protein